MYHSIDYYSFTLLFDQPDYPLPVHQQRAANMLNIMPYLPPLVWERGIRPGLKSTAKPVNGIQISIGAGWLLVELSGQGCELLRSLGKLDELIYMTADRCTRIDVCTDIYTVVRPKEFAEQRDEKRITTISHVVSNDGETMYLGSRSSNRHCKIYRYNDPHPRSDFLRIEYTYRQEDAKTVATLLAAGKSVQQVALASAAKYGWLHPCWNPQQDSSGFHIPAYRKPREKAKTLYWFYTQVVPAIHALINEGIITHQEVIDATKPVSKRQRLRPQKSKAD